jgi:hypothetical protein
VVARLAPIHERECAAALIPLLFFEARSARLTLTEESLAPDAPWSHRRCRNHSARPPRGHRADVSVSAAHPDEYQDGVSAGSLVKARRCWLELWDADALHLPQRFTFAFGCPSQHMARGLARFLQYAHYAGFVRATDRVRVPQTDPWQVGGTTHAAVWSLPSLEHLFMRLRKAGSRYESALVTLDLLPMVRCVR